MARLIRCPRCPSQLDVTRVAGGATVRCPDCGASVRVPTGQTGQFPKVAAPVPPAPSSSGRGKTTALFRKMAAASAPGLSDRPGARLAQESRSATRVRRRSASQTGLLVGSVAGFLVLVVLLVVMVNQQSARRAEEEAARKARAQEQRRKAAEEARRAREEEAAAEAEYQRQLAARKDASAKPASLTRKGGSYQAPPTFEPGARKYVQGAPPTVGGNPDLAREFEGLIASGRIDEIVKDDPKWLPYVLEAMLSDDEKVARGAFQAMHDICAKHRVTTESGKNPVSLEYINSAYYRGNEFTYWLEWYQRNRQEIAERGGKGAGAENARIVGEDPARADWPKLMEMLRPGGGYDDPKRPEGLAFAKVKAMGPGAYPYLVRHIDDEDIMIARAAVRVLNELTGQNRPLPTEATKGQARQEWEIWLKREEQKEGK